MNKPLKKTGSQKARNSAARLLAAQAVYQMLRNNQSAIEIIPEFLEHRTGIDVDGDEMVSPDIDHFSKLIRGVEENFQQLSEMISANRQKQSAQETEPLLQAIFLCGAYELMVLQSLDAPLIIAEYVHVAQAFYENSEAKLVNAVLDSIRKTVRV